MTQKYPYPYPNQWWNPDEFEKKRPYLEKRIKVIKSIRNHFDNQGFYEVETPALQVSPGMEPHLMAFETAQYSPNRERHVKAYLHTSPEFTMKKLIVAGVAKQYQICKVFRNAEGAGTHSPEFTMIEWYRAHDSYETIMDDCINLMRDVANAVGISHYEWRGKQSNPFKEWEKISVAEAFQRYANICLEDHLEKAASFAEAARTCDLDIPDDYGWDDIFFRIFEKIIEPQLGHPVPTILYDYPVHMAALSRVKQDDPRWAERFEIYICGLELANAFGELTDASIQQKRFEEDMALKQSLYNERYPIDKDFIAALESGMPDSGGIALGIDRLVMLAANADTIEQILWAPVSLMKL